MVQAQALHAALERCHEEGLIRPRVHTGSLPGKRVPEQEPDTVRVLSVELIIVVL